MKTKFYKRLVPLALIASMAVTNVGITSASANTPVAIEQTTGMDAPVVGEDAVTHTGVESGDASKYGLANSGTEVPCNFQLNSSGEVPAGSTVDITVDLTTNADTDVLGTLTKYDFCISKFKNTTSTNFIVDHAESIDATNRKVTFKVPVSTFTVTDHTANSQQMFILVWTKADSDAGTDEGWATTNANKLMLKYGEKAYVAPAQQQTVAAGDAFQIPGGLTSKGTTVNAYTVGVAKVVTANAGDNEVLADSIKQTDDATDNTLGTWGGEEATKPATGASLAGKYVLYYVPNGSEAKTFVRILTNDEAAKLPKGTFKTDANLTTYTDASATGATDTDQYKIEHSTATVEGAATQPKTMKDFFGIVFKLANNLNSAFDDTTNGYTANTTGEVTADGYVGKIAVPENDTTGQVEVPAISSVAKDKVLIKDKAFVDALIADYDEGKTGSDVFAEKSTTTGTGDDAVTTKWLTIEEDGSYTVSKDGADALYEILSKENFANAKKYMTADGVAETTKKLYEEVYARAKALYINAYNAKMAASDPDLSLLQWTMETLSGDKGTDAKGKEVYTKTNGNAKFWGKNLTKKKVGGVTSTAEATKVAASARVKGATASITATKAASKFNNTVYLKAVKDAYVTPTAKTEAQAANVIFTEQFFVTPALPTAFTDKSLTPPAAKPGIKLEQAEGYSNDANTTRNFKLTLDAGKSFKLPFALKDGVEKDLVYEVGNGAKGFTVVNGKVTATDANTGSANDTIKVYSRVLGEDALYATVTVKVDEAVKSTRANTTSMVVWPGSSQQITLGTNPASKPGDFKYKITNGDTTNLEVKAMKWNTVSTTENDVTTINTEWKEVDLVDGFLPNDSCVLVVKEKEGGDASKVAKNTAIKVELYKSDGTTKVDSIKKDLEIKVTGVTAPQDYKGVKTAVKSKETTDDGTKIINVPVGGSVNLGYAVTPAAANATITSTSDDPAKAVINGDVVYGVAEGTANVTLTPNGNIAYGFKSKDTTNGTIKYKINVYNPGSSIVLPNDDDNANYVIKGGFLMEEGAAATTCNKDFPAGKAIVLDAPTAGTTEEIIWKANNPAAVKIEQSGDDLSIIPAIPGTYTITGTTKYTNQSLKFKINVVANATDAEVAEAKTGATLSIDSANLKVGEKANAFFVVPNSTTGGVGAKVTFESSDKNVAVISGNGTITAKAAGPTNITAKMANGAEKTVPLTVLPAAVTTKSVKCAEGAIAGEQFAVSAAFNKFDKKTMELEWYAVAKNAGEDAEKIASTNFTALAKDKLSGKVSFKDAGSYDIYVSVKESKSGGSVLETAKVGTVNVYTNAVKAANINNADADTKKAIAALGAKVKEGAHNGAGSGQDYYVPVFVTPKADDKPVPAATVDDVTFNISNKSLASAEFIPQSGITDDVKTALKTKQENDIVKDYEKAYGLIKITTPEATPKLSGIVTVKATLKNSNKTVSVKLNVLGETLEPATKYDPQNVNLAGADETPTLATVVKALKASDTASPLISKLEDDKTKLETIAKNKKLAAGKKITAWQYVLINDSNIANVNKALATKAIICNEATVNQTAQTLTKLNATASNNGTYYLALAQVDYEVQTPYVAEVKEGDTVKTPEAQATFKAPVVKKVISIASKTPMVKGAAATPQEDTTEPTTDNTNP